MTLRLYIELYADDKCEITDRSVLVIYQHQIQLSTAGGWTFKFCKTRTLKEPKKIKL